MLEIQTNPVLTKTFTKHCLGLNEADFKQPSVRHRLSSFYPHLQFVYLNQVHGSEVVVYPQDSNLKGDAIITDRPNTALVILHGDCQAAMFFDPVKQVVAAAHAGWKGLTQNIYQLVVTKLEEDYDVDPATLQCTIAPSLGMNHSEFVHYKDEFPKNLWAFVDGRFHADLKAMARHQLLTAGLLSRHISISPVCSYESMEYYSYRKTKTAKRNATMISLVSDLDIY